MQTRTNFVDKTSVLMERSEFAFHEFVFVSVVAFFLPPYTYASVAKKQYEKEKTERRTIANIFTAIISLSEARARTSVQRHYTFPNFYQRNYSFLAYYLCTKSIHKTTESKSVRIFFEPFNLVRFTK